MKRTLKREFLGILSLGLLLAFALQVSIRTFSELPTLYRLEAESDQNAMQQVQQYLSVEDQYLQQFALDYSNWDRTYDFVASKPGGRKWKKYIEEEVSAYTLNFNELNGWIFLDANHSLVHSFSINRETEESGPDLDLTNPAVLETLTTRSRSQSKWAYAHSPEVVNSGYVETNQGPVTFVSTEIRNSEGGGKLRGTLVMWRFFDENYWQGVGETLGIQLDFVRLHEAKAQDDLAETIAKLESFPGANSPRGNGESIHWLLRDSKGAPFMLARQAVPPRGFDERWVTASVLVSFGAFGLVLLMIGVFFSRRVLKPIADLRDIAKRIGKGELHLTASVPNQQEIGELSESINSMSANLLEARAHLEELAFKDSITGLPNRRIFMEFLSKALENARRSTRKPGRLALLFIDLDGFKTVNDTAGHEAGDYVLQQVGARLLHCLRSEDTVARTVKGAAIEESVTASRFGGDEFTVLISNLESLPIAGVVADRILTALAAPYLFKGMAHNITCSIGIATFPEDSKDPVKLIQCADHAMYAAKQSGKNQHRYYDPVTAAQGNDRLGTIDTLSREIEEK
jgi:diguanylate cyclase (GGDEF)-like protein